MNFLKNLSCAFIFCVFVFPQLFARTYFIKSEDFQFPCGWEFTRFVGNSFLWARSPEAQTAFSAFDFPEGGDFAVWANTSDNPSNNPGTRTHEVLIDGRSVGVSGTHGKDGFAWQRLSDASFEKGVHMLGIKKVGSHARSRYILLTTDKNLDPSKLSASELDSFGIKPVDVKTSYEDLFPRVPVLKGAEDKGTEVCLENGDVKICFKPMLMPDGKTIGVRTFSPLFAISYISSDQAWRTAPYDQFEFVIDK